MRPLLLHHPIHNSSAIIRRFQQGEPLTSDQINFLEWQPYLSYWHELDPIFKYYIESLKKKRNRRFKSSFLLPHEDLNQEDIKKLKKRLRLYLQNQKKSVVIPMTEKQFLQFNDYDTQDLIYYHGNQFLTGAPFVPGGIPHVVYFQWGNFFGVVKYNVLPEEKALKSNLLIYFEDMQDRTLNQCVEEYKHKIEANVKEKPSPILQPSHEIFTFPSQQHSPLPRPR